MGKAAAAVSIDCAMSKNVFPPFTKLKSVLPVRGELKTSSSQFCLPLIVTVPQKYNKLTKFIRIKKND